jgi:hypothetical protein
MDVMAALILYAEEVFFFFLTVEPVSSKLFTDVFME